MENLRHLYETYKRAVLRVTNLNEDGDYSCATAFHIGDGWLVTAAHVITDGTVQEIVSLDGRNVEVKDIIVHPNDQIDVAIVETDFELTHYLNHTTGHNAPDGYVKTDHIPIGGHMDDWLGDEFVLSKVLLMGFPPVPLSQHPTLIASEGEVNAVVDKYIGPHPHFVISCVSRGGYSGGPVISEYGFLLGILTESLIRNYQPDELGFASAISIEPLLDMLVARGVRPASNKELLDELYRYTNGGHD